LLDTHINACVARRHRLPIAIGGSVGRAADPVDPQSTFHQMRSIFGGVVPQRKTRVRTVTWLDLMAILIG
jgi:hypothetical protein